MGNAVDHLFNHIPGILGRFCLISIQRGIGQIVVGPDTRKPR